MHKTAALLNLSITAGGIVAGADDKQIEKLESYSDSIGLAFQVADDILDCTADSAKLGKTAGKDEATDKATYVRMLGLDGAKAEAGRLRDLAVDCVEGEEGEALRCFADFIVRRDH